MSASQETLVWTCGCAPADDEIEPEPKSNVPSSLSLDREAAARVACDRDA